MYNTTYIIPQLYIHTYRSSPRPTNPPSLVGTTNVVENGDNLFYFLNLNPELYPTTTFSKFQRQRTINANAIKNESKTNKTSLPRRGVGATKLGTPFSFIYISSMFQGRQLSTSSVELGHLQAGD